MPNITIQVGSEKASTHLERGAGPGGAVPSAKELSQVVCALRDLNAGKLPATEAPSSWRLHRPVGDDDA